MIIIGWLLAGLFFVLLPFFVIGWVLSGWRPWLMSFILWALAVFVFHLWAFGPIFLPFQYLLALAGYSWGGSKRTGKEVDQVLQTSKASQPAPVISDEQE